MEKQQNSVSKKTATLLKNNALKKQRKNNKKQPLTVVYTFPSTMTIKPCLDSSQLPTKQRKQEQQQHQK